MIWKRDDRVMQFLPKCAKQVTRRSIMLRDLSGVAAG